MPNDSRPRIVDLFSGAGGFSLGSHWAGFDVSLAVDSDPILSSSYAMNFPSVKVCNWDLNHTDAQQLLVAAKGRPTGVVGGPPCQAFSEIGRRRPGDERRDLIEVFFRIVSQLRPTFFVMENVRGLGFESNMSVLQKGLDIVSNNYAFLGPFTVDAARHGAPTVRKRLFVVGVLTSMGTVPELKRLVSCETEPPTVHDAIHDLASAKPCGIDSNRRDWWRYDKRLRVSSYARTARMTPPRGMGLGAVPGCFSGHTKTQHTEAVVRRFSAVDMGGQDQIGKHPRLDWNRQAPTLRAGTGSDRGSYQSVRPIHPTENRVITTREAARLQGFPDWFLFHPTRWHSFRMIGNSVSPFVSQAILSWIFKEIFDANCRLKEAAE